MPGTKIGGQKAAATNKRKHGSDFYSRIGRKGGLKSHPETRPFTLNPELAKRAGHNGGTKSRRGPSKKHGGNVYRLLLTDEQIARIKQELAEAE